MIPAGESRARYLHRAKRSEGTDLNSRGDGSPGEIRIPDLALVLYVPALNHRRLESPVAVLLDLARRCRRVSPS